MNYHILYAILLLILCILSYGFVDSNLVLSRNAAVMPFLDTISGIVRSNRIPIAGVFCLLVCLLYGIYVLLLRSIQPNDIRKGVFVIAVCLGIGVMSYPAFSYDIFNYILTAKVAYQYKENPYVVMPVEFPNEPMLAYTRAANKVAIYGPTWILFTAIPFIVSPETIWWKIIGFKVFVGFWYGFVCWLLWRKIRRIEAVMFFALNPLVIIEVLVSGHNDIVMMALALSGFLLLRDIGWKKRLTGAVFLLLSVFVKGATAGVLAALPFANRSVVSGMKMVFWTMFMVFLLTPVREELYPWYAVWFIPFAAFLPRGSFERGFTIVVTFGLLLRHAPYIATFDYGGPGPLLRTLMTIIPLASYLFILGLRRIYRWRRS